MKKPKTIIDVDRGEIQSMIETEIKKTKRQIEEYKDLSQPIAPDDAYGRVSRMDAINNKSITDAALRQAEYKLQQLKQVCHQVDSKEFGYYRRCKNPIPIGRILIKPDSPFCVHCAR
jgi:DnaK suppressor protein